MQTALDINKKNPALPVSILTPALQCIAGVLVGTAIDISISTQAFAFNLSFKLYSSMKIHHVNRAYLAQEIVRCYDQ